MKRAFTLIELLVVIAIIAILAAILFPVFAQAKAAAKKSADLSNVKQVSLGMTLYSSDTDDVYPTAYFHRNFNPGGGVPNGYDHWSGLAAPYVKNLDLYVSPGDNIKGHAPTCFASIDNNSGRGVPAGQTADRCTGGNPAIVPANFIRGGSTVDNQVPRLSYTVNGAVIPRLRNIADVNRGISVVSQTSLDSVANTILVAGMVDNLNCLNGQSFGSGARNSSHRSTNGFSTATDGRTAYFGSAEDGAARPANIFALNFQSITGGALLGPNSIFRQCQTGTTGLPLITYHSVNRWNEGDNYGMADGSARYMKFARTLNPQQYAWGMRVYTDGGAPVLDPISGLQVQQ